MAQRPSRPHPAPPRGLSAEPTLSGREGRLTARPGHLPQPEPPGHPRLPALSGPWPPSSRRHGSFRCQSPRCLGSESPSLPGRAADGGTEQGRWRPGRTCSPVRGKAVRCEPGKRPLSPGVCSPLSEPRAGLGGRAVGEPCPAQPPGSAPSGGRRADALPGQQRTRCLWVDILGMEVREWRQLRPPIGKQPPCLGCCPSYSSWLWSPRGPWSPLEWRGGASGWRQGRAWGPCFPGLGGDRAGSPVLRAAAGGSGEVPGPRAAPSDLRPPVPTLGSRLRLSSLSSWEWPRAHCPGQGPR